MGELYQPFPKLPKNIRQIGERDQMVRLYLEDYVNTYLKRLYPSGGQDLRIGILLGSSEVHDGVPYIFVDGALEMENVTENGEQVVFSEAEWKKAYQQMEEMFPKRAILGWFLCGAPGCQLSPLNYWKQHGQYFSGKNQIMYLNGGLEGEESVYITSSDGFYKLRGHNIYYERNQMMQDYMILRKDVRRVESGGSDPVIRDFRSRMESKKEAATSYKGTIRMLGGICSALSVVVIAGGVVLFGNYERMKEMETVVASVLPENMQVGDTIIRGKEKPRIVIEEAAGEVYPTTAAETMEMPEELTESVAENQTAEGQESRSDVSQSVSGDGQGESQNGKDESQDGQGESQNGQDISQTESEAQTGLSEEASSPKTYTIQDGETLYGICFKIYNNLKPIDEICRLNGLEDVNHIVSGQKLRLP